jgi:protocatechuate 3,4-dioxygenase beta subunit
MNASRRRALSAATAFALLICGDFTPAGAQPAQTKQPTPPPAAAAQSRMTIRAVDEQTGAPLAGVELQFNGTIGDQPANRTLQTNVDGLAQFEYPTGAKIQRLTMYARKPRFVPQNYVWQGQVREIELQPRIELSMAAGHPIGGVVRNEAGQPIPGVQLQLYLPITWPKMDGYVYSLASPITDENGRWQFDAAPADLSSLHINARHADYLRGSSNRSGLALNNNNVLVLKQGPTVTGRVVDADGKPVPFATVRAGRDSFGTSDPETQTDRDGRFTLKNCQPGDSAVTVQADGFAPQFQRIAIAGQNEPLEFKLEKGHVFRARIVDVDGQPIAGAFVSPDTWRGLRTVQQRMTTDQDGRVEWRSAPPDAVEYSIGKTGYMSLRNKLLSPGEEEQVVTMNPELVITGRVTDAATGKPLPAFTIRRGQLLESGQERIYWSRDAVALFKNGAYSFKFSEPSKGFQLQVEAEGYLPATSRMFKSEEGTLTFDFALKAGTGAGGTVLLPGGEPAAGAEIAAATRESQFQVSQGRFSQDRGTELTKTNEAGRFSLRPVVSEQPFLLVILHDAGFAEVTREQLAKSDRITLTPWGRIEGRVLIGDRPDVERDVMYAPQRVSAGSDTLRNSFWGYNYRTKTDAEGKFSFDRVVPGPGTAYRMVVTQHGDFWTNTPGWNTAIEVRPNETAKLSIGGTGRPVTGGVITDRQPDEPIAWLSNEPAAITPRRSLLRSLIGQRATQDARYLGGIDESGKFTIPDVPAGEYTLSVNLYGTESRDGIRNPIGSATFDFTVPAMPDGRSDEPLDLGQITAKLLEVLEPGKTAPDLVVAGLDGKTLRSADFRGKLMLISFELGGRGGNLADLPVQKRLYDQFGKDANFVIVTVWCSGQPDAIKQLVDANGWKWHHGTAQGLQSRPAQAFMVRSLPATFLIGGNGRVIARNPKEADLKQSIDSLLSLGELFETGTAAERPPRFPFTRHEAAADAKPLAAAPAVVVADDTDPEFEKSQPRDDRLRLLAADGGELWSQGGLNNAQTVGAVHGVAIDRQRGRFYVREDVTKRLTAYSVSGQKLWQVDQLDVEAVAVDEKTGNVWASGGHGLNDGETVVFDSDGREVTAFPFRGIDLVYDPHTEAFWFAGYELMKVNRAGEVLFRKRAGGGWCYVSAAVNRADGSVWVVERAHTDIGGSKNRLWLHNADGSVRKEIALEGNGASAVAYSPQSGRAWINSFGGGLRTVSAEGEFSDPIPINAFSIAISPTNGDIWVATKDAVLKIDDTGRELAKSPFRGESQQSWIAAF